LVFRVSANVFGSLFANVLRLQSRNGKKGVLKQLHHVNP
jgi:hypothetical protein